MRRIVASYWLTSLVIAAAACGGEASAASVDNLNVHVEPPRSIGTPVTEIARISGPTGAKRIMSPGSGARLIN